MQGKSSKHWRPSSAETVFWDPPRVSIRPALMNAFFTTIPFPRFIDPSKMGYFFAALTELSQLVHAIALNTPMKGFRVCDLTRAILVYHIQHFLEISFLDPVFISNLVASDPNDSHAVRFVEVLHMRRHDFIDRWNAAVHADMEDMSPEELKGRLTALKKVADAISASAVCLVRGKERVTVCLPFVRRVDIFTTDGHIPNWLILVWLLWGFVTAFGLLILTWVQWYMPNSWSPIAGSCITAFGFGGFLLFFYTLSRRRELSQWYAQQLATNFTRNCFITCPEKSEEASLEFFIQQQGSSALRSLRMKPLAIHRQVVMIGVTDVETLRVCSWNLSASWATGISTERAIGKPLGLILDPRSVPVAKSLLEEAKGNSLQQRRLLFHSATKGMVTIRATATIAQVDSLPIAMILGTVLEEEEGMMLSYFSRIGTNTLLSKLDESGPTDPFTRNIVYRNSWDVLKERATRAIQCWRMVSLDELVAPLITPTFRPRVETSYGASVPTHFQCDIIFIRTMLVKMIQGISSDKADFVVHLAIDGKKYSNDQCELLQLCLTVPEGCHMNLSSIRDAPLINDLGYLYDATDTRAEMRIPISASAIAPTTSKARPDDHAGRLIGYFFVVYEPDPAYEAHLTSFFIGLPHRYYFAKSVSELSSVLQSWGKDVSAVILSECGELYSKMLRVCTANKVFTVVSRVSTGAAPQLAFETPIPEDVTVNHVLYKPIEQAAWDVFLKLLQDVRRQHEAIEAPVRHDYQLVKAIGSGAESRVDLVYDTFTGGQLARKTVYVSSGRSIAALTTEVRIMNLLNHPNVIGYIGTERPTTREFCMFLQYCPGGTLSQFVQSRPNRRLTPAELKPIANQLLAAVEYIHSKGVAHRDIKPENILLHDRKVNRLALADFGSATQDPSRAGSSDGGSLPYMAPERLTEVSPLWGKSSGMECLFAEDIWSVGLTLLQLLGAYPPSLRHLDMAGYTHAYMELRDGEKELPFEIPVDPDGRPGDDVVVHSFFRPMLSLQPSDRPTATELLLHPYLLNTKWPPRGGGPLVDPVYVRGVADRYASSVELAHSTLITFNAMSEDDNDINFDDL